MGATTIHRTRVDKWLAVLMVLPAIGGIAAVVAGVTHGDALTRWIGVGALVGYGLLLGVLVLPMRYEIADDGVTVRAGVQRLVVPWDRLGVVKLSSNPLSSPALSLRRIHVTYTKPNGKQRWVLISPQDREQFLRELAERSPRHHLVDGELRPRG